MAGLLRLSTTPSQPLGLLTSPISRSQNAEIRTMSDNADTKTWPELAIALYDRLTERNAEIAYNFEDLHVGIPSSTESKEEHALWKLNGAIRVTTRSGAAV